MTWIVLVAIANGGVVVYDVTQRKHAVLRSIPVAGHSRCPLESAVPISPWLLSSGD
jgi:hypothetical protein